jgi:hypothetical protein
VSKGRIITSLTVVIIGGLPVIASAQEPSTPEQVAMRRQIALMQTALEAAVTSGASDLTGMLSRVTGVPPETHLVGRPQADGFKLPGQMFFHVRVPDMSATALFAVSLTRERPQAIAGARVTVRQPVREGPSVPPVSPLDIAPVLPPPDLEELLNDPNAVYVAAIRSNLIETMLRNSHALEVPPDEFLTVAARKDQRLNPWDPASGRTMVFSVRGRDLEEYHQRRITIEEARKRVVVTTY